MNTVERILRLFDLDCGAFTICQFCSEEDGAPYHAWKIEKNGFSAVLKKVSPMERVVYETFFSQRCAFVPFVYGFREIGEESYMLMEYLNGETMSHCDREKLKRTLDSLIEMQDKFWENTKHEHVGYSFCRCLDNRKKRLPFMGDLGMVYQEYLKSFETVPRTLCNDDMLPFNVIVNDTRAVFIDWEFGGILPYPCALARLLAFGEDAPDAMFYMSAEDQVFAVKYYFDNLVARKDISWETYIRTMKLFFFKEYSEWVYCANSSGDMDMPNYKKYYAKAKKLAHELGHNIDEMEERI